MITGNTIELVRRIKHLSQEYVAKKMDISQLTLSKLECGNEPLQSYFIEKFLGVINESKDWLENISKGIINNQNIETNHGNGFVTNYFAAENESLHKIITAQNLLIEKQNDIITKQNEIVTKLSTKLK